MGRESTQKTTPDLFSTDAVRDVSAELMERTSDRATAAATPSKRHILPENLDHAVAQLNDDELIQLIEVALKEAKRRGKSQLQTEGSAQPFRPTEPLKPRSTEKTSNRTQVVAELALSPVKLNAVRAAFKAGVTPLRI